MTSSHAGAVRLIQGMCLAVCLVVPSTSWAATEQNFKVNTTEDLVNLCATQPSDPLYTPAANFCEGFLVGAYQYHTYTVAAEGRKPLVCPPSPPPTRNETVAKFIDWGRMNRSAMGTQPVEGMFQFLAQTFPCRG
jgi:hypothetical protein